MTYHRRQCIGKFIHNTCQRKKVYVTRKFAKAAAKRLQKETGFKMSAYKCRVCGNFHVGKPEM